MRLKRFAKLRGTEPLGAAQESRTAHLMRKNPVSRNAFCGTTCSENPVLRIQKAIRRSKYPSAASFGITQVADKFLPEMIAAVDNMLAALRDHWTEDEIAEHVSAGSTISRWLRDVEQFARGLVEGVGVASTADSIWDVALRVFRAGAEQAIVELDRFPIEKAAKPKPKVPTIGMQITFDESSPEVVEFIRRYKFELVTQVSKPIIEALRQVILQAALFGGHPYEQARIIRTFIGLTKSQAAAVDAFRLALESGRILDALRRDLRDARFDRTLQAVREGRKVLTQAQIDNMVKRYQERYLKYRSEMIARTETIRSANAGQQAIWNKAVKDNLLPDNMRVVWIVTADDRTCPECEAIPDENPDGVPLNGLFATGYGPLEYPPAHPMCRCATALERSK